MSKKHKKSWLAKQYGLRNLKGIKQSEKQAMHAAAKAGDVRKYRAAARELQANRLCAQCHRRLRLAALTRCKECLQADAARDRERARNDQIAAD